jgi:DNA-directed RNA polymerase subunit omega
MLYPSIYSLLEKVDNSRYTLVILAARRARQVVDGREPLTKVVSNSPVTLAINEINENTVTYSRQK